MGETELEAMLLCFTRFYLLGWFLSIRTSCAFGWREGGSISALVLPTDFFAPLSFTTDTHTHTTLSDPKFNKACNVDKVGIFLWQS